jgi:hypothetical protein
MNKAIEIFNEEQAQAESQSDAYEFAADPSQFKHLAGDFPVKVRKMPDVFQTTDEYINWVHSLTKNMISLGWGWQFPGATKHTRHDEKLDRLLPDSDARGASLDAAIDWQDKYWNDKVTPASQFKQEIAAAIKNAPRGKK